LLTQGDGVQRAGDALCHVALACARPKTRRCRHHLVKRGQCHSGEVRGAQSGTCLQYMERNFNEDTPEIEKNP
jgi:hypothetical protein